MWSFRPTRFDVVENGQRLFFVHIPKTAGVTLNSTLEHHFFQEDIFPYYRWAEVPADWPLQRLQGYRLFRGHFFHSSITSLLPDPPATLTMLRHPIDRILSAFNHTSQDLNNPHHQAIGGESGSLMDYIRMSDKNPTRNQQVTYLSCPPPPEKSVAGARRSYRMDPTDIQDLVLACKNRRHITAAIKSHRMSTLSRHVCPLIVG